MLWDEVIPFYETDEQDSSLFSTSFTSTMELKLDQIETGKQNAAVVWDNFATSFRQLHEADLAQKRSKHTKSPIEYFERFSSGVSPDE